MKTPELLTQPATSNCQNLFFRSLLVVLRQYSDEGSSRPTEAEEYDAGLVTIWREPAADVDSHGTTIILTDIRPPTRDTLRSRDLWAVVDSDPAMVPDEVRSLKPPSFHIGRVRSDDDDILRSSDEAYDSLPWSRSDRPEAAFENLVDAVWRHVDSGTPNPKLGGIFDYYLQMVWQLSLAIPAPYVSGNPFDLPLKDDLYLFEMPQADRAAPEAFDLSGDETVSMKKSIGAAAAVGSDFTVLVDDLRLARPIVFADLPETTHAVKKPILAVGRCREQFDGVPPEFAGGPLEFEAYLIWAPKIVPTEHQGVLIRVHGSSGTLFDPTFLRYQVSEQTRLRQISCEIFVSEGLEAALNIDRESFNYAHPHVVYITKWLHSALRRMATVQKRIAAEIRVATREAAAAGEEEVLSRIATRVWQDEFDDPGAEPPPVEFEDEVDEPKLVERGAYHFRRGPVFGKGGGRRTLLDRSNERKLRAMVQVFAAYGILEGLSDQQQERLLSGMRQILEASEQ